MKIFFKKIMIEMPKIMMKNVVKFLKWFIGIGFYERSKLSPAETFLLTMRVTAKCRFNAANRLGNLNKFSFLTTTLLSLGLIFIPLAQNSDIDIAIKQGVINMMQIFLAVSVLVYSIIIGTSKYEVRSEKLTACGDSLKELIRKLNKKIKENSLELNELEDYQVTYAHIISKTENPQNVDYIIATLDMGRDYKITGLRRLHLKIKSYFLLFIPYYIPVLMLSLEAAFIFFMLVPDNAPEFLKLSS